MLFFSRFFPRYARDGVRAPRPAVLQKRGFRYIEEKRAGISLYLPAFCEQPTLDPNVDSFFSALVSATGAEKANTELELFLWQSRAATAEMSNEAWIVSQERTCFHWEERFRFAAPYGDFLALQGSPRTEKGKTYRQIRYYCAFAKGTIGVKATYTDEVRLMRKRAPMVQEALRSITFI